MPFSLRAIIQELENKLDGEAIDSDNEHARWSLYVRAAEVESCWPELREVAVLEEDSAVSSSLVLRMLGRVSAEDREGWSRLLSMEKDRNFALRRAQELNFLEAVLAGSHRRERDDLQFETWSPWLQLHLAESCEDREILALLRDSGQTKRIRATAANRIRVLRRA